VDTGKRDVNRRVVASGGKLQPEGKVRSAMAQWLSRVETLGNQYEPWSVRAGKKISREGRYGDARRPARFFGGL